MPRMVDMIGGSGNGNVQDRGKGEDYLSISKSMISAIRKNDSEEAKKTGILYEKIVGLINLILEKIKKDEDITVCMQDLYVMFDDLFNRLVMGEAILEEVYETRDGYYLPFHIANLLILSSFLGIKMGLNKSGLRDLGLTAIFCDVGLDQYKDIISKPSELNKQEYELIKSHILKSAEIVGRIPQINKTVKDAIRSHHERADGAGYPGSLKANEICDYAKIIGLVDTYDALTNHRTYREGKNAHKTIRFIVSSLKESFDHETLRSLLNALSLYPIGTLVELDTGEVARVINTDPGYPLRPIVRVVQDFSGKPVKEKKIINLAVTDKISITNSL